MRTRVVNILLSLLSVGLVTALFIVGVIAATNITASINNTFSFEVSDDELFLDIAGEVSGYKTTTPVSTYQHHYDYTDPQDFLPWNVPNLQFDYNAVGQVKDIVFTFTVSNYNQNKRIKMEIVDYEATPPSVKIKNTPSQAVILENLKIENGQEILDTKQISVSVSVLDESADFQEINRFTLKFTVV